MCSCTVIPLFAGIYKKGAGLGPAITFLFVAPAINILALSYTGTALGLGLAIARLVLSIAFGIGAGIIRAMIFHKEDIAHDKATDAMFARQTAMRRDALIFLLLLVALLVVVPHTGGATLQLTGKFFGVLVLVILLGWMLRNRLTQDETRDFLWESWRFVKQIFPFLVVGVFVVGMVRELIRPQWILPWQAATPSWAT